MPTARSVHTQAAANIRRLAWREPRSESSAKNTPRKAWCAYGARQVRFGVAKSISRVPQPSRQLPQASHRYRTSTKGSGGSSSGSTPPSARANQNPVAAAIHLPPTRPTAGVWRRAATGRDGLAIAKKGLVGVTLQRCPPLLAPRLEQTSQPKKATASAPPR